MTMPSVLICLFYTAQISHIFIFFLQILVEFDYVDWDKRDWLNVYKDHFHLLAVEQNLVLAHRSNSMGNLQPALVIFLLHFRDKYKNLWKWISIFATTCFSSPWAPTHTRANCVHSSCNYGLFNVIISRVLRLRRNTHRLQTTSFDDNLLSRACIGHHRKGWIVRDTTTLLGQRVLLLPKLERVVPTYSLSVAVWPTARHWPDTVY